MITSEWPTAEHPEWVPFLVQQVNSLRRAGVEVDVFHFRGAKKPWNYLKARRSVQQRLESTHYDLIHAQFGQSALLALPCRPPLVVTFRGSDVLGIVGRDGKLTKSGRLLQFSSRIVAHWADDAIVVSRCLMEHLPKRSYYVIPGGIDFKLFHPGDQSQARQDLGLDSDRRYVLFGANPGNFLKRFDLASQAVDLAWRQFPDLEMVVLKNVPHEQVPLYMIACDALLLTSVHEGSSNVVKEALACNLPVVSTDVGDVRERLGPVVGCVVCEDDRPETIAAGLSQVVSKRQRVQGWNAVQDLDEDRVTQQVIQVYQKRLGQ
ncbi:MAG: glycosyltransferase [Chloroflexi bacterium]|nr:glycosyltransferase [Chloroflexota bacterium]